MMGATGYEKPQFLTPLVLWVLGGESGKVMCFDCQSSACTGCPQAWREIDGRTEYFKPPLHGHRETRGFTT